MRADALFAFIAVLSILASFYSAIGILLPRLPLVRSRKRAVLMTVTTFVAFVVAASVGMSLEPPEARQAREARRAEEKRAEQAQPTRKADVEKQPQQPQPESLEYKLASLDHGEPVPYSDPAVARFQALLGQLATKYSATPQQVADMTVTGRKMLLEKGISESFETIMAGMNNALDKPIPDSTYDQYLSLYVTHRVSGKSRYDALGSLNEDLLIFQRYKMLR